MIGEVPAVSVIIPNWNGRKFLAACLDSLDRQNYANLQVFVVDNGSTDGSADLISGSYPKVILVRLDRNYGFGEAVNHGIARCHSSFVALLNNDTEADAGWVASCVEALEGRPDIGYVASQMRDFFDRERLDSAGDIMTRSGLPLKRGMDEPASHYPEPHEVLGASAGAAFFRKEVLDQVGPFDADYFMYLEDVDWCLRAALQGIRCLYVPGARVYHVEGGSDPRRRAFLERGETRRRHFHTPERTYWITRNRIRLLVKNYPGRLLLKYFPSIVFGFARSALFHLLKSGLFGSFLRGFCRGLAEIPQCLPLRRRIQGRRKVSVRQFEATLFGAAAGPPA